jgi:hypothetical protein
MLSTSKFRVSTGLKHFSYFEDVIVSNAQLVTYQLKAVAPDAVTVTVILCANAA